MTPSAPQNRLKGEKSPYLLQHAANPVDWRPWGDEAFAEAARLDKPIFLSIGYSTCHWCHVMAHESFEDPTVARLMNRHFINIKVDREERPDIDGVYMNVCQMMTGRGGWPLTIFMSADKRPFYAATYIPKSNRFGQVGMMELLPRITEIWQTRRQDIDQTARQIVSALHQDGAAATKEEPQRTILRTAYDQIFHIFDDVHGGFGTAPKFPTPQNILFLLRFWKRYGNPAALNIVETTLASMRRGGIYDHIGFGFHRYSVDQSWTLPHFEKMLYDQAMLAYAYTEAYQATGDHTYAETAKEIISYVMDGMTSPDGAFYSAEDADSDGEEGKFYLWTLDEIQSVLTRDEADLIIALYRIEKTGNYTDEITRQKTGKNLLRLHRPLKETADEMSIPGERLRLQMEQARRKLYAFRGRRIPPHKDDKVLVDWNGLMIAALARTGLVLDETAYVEAAERAARFILAKMKTASGRILHRFRDGEAGIAGQIDDYAFFAFGLIELYEASFNAEYLLAALDLTEALLTHFQDDEHGGLFSTPHDGEPMIVRQKEIFEGAMPSGASVAVWNLLRLGHMTARTHLLDQAWDIASFFYPAVRQSPGAFTQFMTALDFAFGPATEIVVVGDPAHEDTVRMLRALRTPFSPNKVILLRRTDENHPAIGRLAPYMQNMESLNGKATAYVCRDNACERPTTDLATMLALLDKRSSKTTSE